MREINFRHSLHMGLGLAAWWLTGKLLRYNFIEVAGPVTARVDKTSSPAAPVSVRRVTKGK